MILLGVGWFHGIGHDLKRVSWRGQSRPVMIGRPACFCASRIVSWQHSCIPPLPLPPFKGNNRGHALSGKEASEQAGQVQGLAAVLYRSTLQCTIVGRDAVRMGF
mmetsp:Transcript_118287/g.367737  ORF Transcript_118287/g.367737 Transcript_118287/m.367737 type:complete len:105 (-) Transcript_118287:32-346(-)